VLIKSYVGLLAVLSYAYALPGGPQFFVAESREPPMQVDLSPIIIIVIAIVALGLLWRVITGTIRLVLSLVVVAAVVYFLWTFLS
jgi:hypothetical protein